MRPSTASHITDFTDAVNPIVNEKSITMNFTGVTQRETGQNGALTSALTSTFWDLVLTSWRLPTVHCLQRMLNLSLIATGSRMIAPIELTSKRRAPPSEHRLMSDYETAHERWTLLEDLHSENWEGRLRWRQVSLLLRSFNVRVDRGLGQVEKAKRVIDDIRRAWAMFPDGVSKHFMMAAVMLNAINTPEYVHVRALVKRDILESKISKPFHSDSILRHINNDCKVLIIEEVRARYQARAQAAERSAEVQTCTNCKDKHHSAEYCVQQGGGMAGMTIAESKARRRAATGK